MSTFWAGPRSGIRLLIHFTKFRVGRAGAGEKTNVLLPSRMASATFGADRGPTFRLTRRELLHEVVTVLPGQAVIWTCELGDRTVFFRSDQPFGGQAGGGGIRGGVA